RHTTLSSRQSGRVASCDITPALSEISPTHSKGLFARKPHNSAKPSDCASSSSRLRPKISIRSGFETNGASARKMNRHFGQSQHQWRPRACCVCRNAVLQLRKTPKYAWYFENLRAISTSDKGLNNEK